MTTPRTANPARSILAAWGLTSAVTASIVDSFPALVRVPFHPPPFFVTGVGGYFSSRESKARARCLCAFIVTLTGADSRNKLVSAGNGRESECLSCLLARYLSPFLGRSLCPAVEIEGQLDPMVEITLRA